MWGLQPWLRWGRVRVAASCSETAAAGGFGRAANCSGALADCHALILCRATLPGSGDQLMACEHVPGGPLTLCDMCCLSRRLAAW